VNAVADYLKEGQQVRVKVLETDDRGRFKLSMKAAAEAAAPVADAASVEAAPEA
jgi:polyribonucleotide nucleotidyltransferase